MDKRSNCKFNMYEHLGRASCHAKSPTVQDIFGWDSRDSLICMNIEYCYFGRMDK